MRCVSGKRSYPTKELAEEALLENWSRNYHNSQSGPINVYQCDDCGEYHFTSKGEINPILQSEDNIKRINRSREANFWEGKFKR